MSTIVIMDIDGVMKPTTNPKALLAHPRNRRYAGVSDFGKFYEIVFDANRWNSFFREARAAARDDIMFIWASAWEEHANSILLALGLDSSWEHLPIIRENIGLGTWKMRSVQPFIEAHPHDTIIWVEDELEGDVFQLAAARGNMLAVRPNPEVGLSDSEMQLIVEFIARMNPRSE